MATFLPFRRMYAYMVCCMPHQHLFFAHQKHHATMLSCHHATLPIIVVVMVKISIHGTMEHPTSPEDKISKPARQKIAMSSSARCEISKIALHFRGVKTRRSGARSVRLNIWKFGNWGRWQKERKDRGRTDGCERDGVVRG